MLLDCDPDSSVRVTLTNVLNARTSEQEGSAMGGCTPFHHQSSTDRTPSSRDGHITLPAPSHVRVSMITIAVTAERHGEPRVALSPEAAKKLTALGCLVKVETGAGTFSRFNDDAMKAAGAQIARNASDALEGADILLKVRRPTANEIKALEPGAIVDAMLSPLDDRAELDALAAVGASPMAMEFVPR